MTGQPRKLWWTKPVKETIARSRVDAEHFQPHFEELEGAIRRSGEHSTLEGLLTHCRRGVQPDYFSDGEVLVINSQHVGPHLINVAGAERTSLDFWTRRLTARAQQNDILLNSTGIGTIGRANCVLHAQKTVVDNHVTILRVRRGAVNPLYLGVFLNSVLGREQTYRWQSGSSGQLEIYPADIKRFVVPLPDEDVQERIADQLRSAYRCALQAEEAAATAEADAVGTVNFRT